ncbi:hypothetical protein TWF103_001174 [Orbilia oligospora]|nr:hypothetical protein TWF103_001174 [Orbilia oligospora]
MSLRSGRLPGLGKDPTTAAEAANLIHAHAVALRWASTRNVTKRPFFPERNGKCTICGDSFPGYELQRLNCGHRHCRDCLRRNYQHVINNPENHPAKCCQGLSFSETSFVLTDEEMKAVLEIQSSHESTKIIPCFSCEGDIYFSDIGRDAAYCSSCDKLTCTICRKEMHDDLCPEDPETEKLKTLAKEEGWTQCPKCNRLVFRVSGCNSMTCLCKTNFCFRCGGLYGKCNCAFIPRDPTEAANKSKADIHFGAAFTNGSSSRKASTKERLNYRILRDHRNLALRNQQNQKAKLKDLKLRRQLKLKEDEMAREIVRLRVKMHELAAAEKLEKKERKQAIRNGEIVEDPGPDPYNQAARLPTADAALDLNLQADLTREKIPVDQQKDRLKKFFKKYPLDQAFNSCEEIRGLAAQKYGGEERQNKIGNLLETLNTFKEVVDGILSCAPESVSAVWLGLGMIIKIVSDDLITCKVIIDVFDNIVTITLFTLLVEKRYLHDVSQGTRDKSMEQMTFEKLQELACAIFDFSWHTQYLNGTKATIIHNEEMLSKMDNALQATEIPYFTEGSANKSIKEGNEMLRDAIETSTERLEEKIKEGNEMAFETVETTMQQSSRVIIEGVTAALETPDDIFNRYIEVFQPSSALENFLLGLNNKKTAYSALTENSWLLANSDYEKWQGLPKAEDYGSFFKLGDNELQSGVRAFESLILQVIKIIKKREGSRAPALLNTILDGNREFDIRNYKTGSSERKCAMIRYYIAAISEMLRVQIYFLLDALDECHDRGKARLLKHLEDLVLAPTPTIKVLVSVREEIGTKNELERSGVKRFWILNLMPRDSSNEMELFLRKKLEQIILTRIKDRNNKDAIRAEVTKYMPKLQKKVEGDFAYANMVIASLQEPSRMSLEARIRNPTFEQITALEIAEHYRGAYTHETADGESYKAFDYSDLSQDPEIQETINHLRIVGRNFFTFIEETEPITVHLTVREWVQKPLNLEKALPNTQMQAKVLNSIGGNLVFEVQIPVAGTPSGHHELSSLFSKKESHLSIAIDCLRAIVNPNFQEQHLPWDPPEDFIRTWGGSREGKSLLPLPKKSRRVNGLLPTRRVRYEVVSLWNHPDALTPYYSRKKMQSDPDWVVLRELFIELTHQKDTWRSWRSWYSFCNYLGRKVVKIDAGTDNSFYRRYTAPDSPLSSLLQHRGCGYLIEPYCYAAGWPAENLGREPHMVFTDLASTYPRKLGGLLSKKMPRPDIWDAPDSLGLCAVIWCGESMEVGDSNLPDNQISDAFRFFARNISVQLTTSAMRSVFLALSSIDIYADLFKINEYDTDGFLLKPTLSNLFDILTLKDSDVQSVSAKREDAIKAFKIFFAEAVKFFIETVKEYWLTSKRWRILKFLIARGAPFDPNTDGDAIFSYSERDIFDDFLDLGYGTSESASKRLFTVARIGYLKLFQKLISGNPGTLSQVDKSGRSIMHALSQRVEGRMEIFGDLESLFDEIHTIQPESVNAQDNKSRAPLPYAVESRNLEGVELLLRYSADVQDDDELGQTALHTLCSQDTTYKEPSGFFGYETRYRGDGP